MIKPIAIAALAAAATQSASAAVIALDGRVSPDSGITLATGTLLVEMRQRLLDMGHTLVTVTSYDAASLAGVDVLLTREAAQAFQAFTPQMAADIAAFNEAGGAVGFFGDGGYSSNSLISSNNLVANVLGANLSGSAFAGSGIVVTGFEDHPVTQGVTEWGLDFVRTVFAMPGSIDLTEDPASINFAVARDGDGTRGNTFVMGDASWMNFNSTTDYEIDDLDNAQAFENIINYLTVPAPSSAAIAAIATLAATRRRR